ncbi:MAG: hypothetical protein Kow0027_27260 [Saprospiraceae bacterium]
MKHLLFLVAIISLALSSGCQSDPKNGGEDQKVDAQISDIEAQVALQDAPNPEQLKTLIRLYEEHANKYPERREVNANFLMKAADCARMLGNNAKAIALYDRIANEFRGTVQAPRALFLKGFLYDTELNRKDSALIVYRTFTWRYKNDPFLDDVQRLMDTLSVQYPEVVEKIEKKELDGGMISPAAKKKFEEQQKEAAN